MHRARSVLPSLVSLLLIFLGACFAEGVSIGPDGLLSDEADPDGLGSDGENDGDDHPPGPLHPDTLLVEEHPCFEYAEILADDRSEILLGFSCDPAAVGLRPGRIVAGIQGGGYLRRIESVVINDPMALLMTSEATVAEAVTDVVFDETVDLSGRQTVDFSGRSLDEVDIEEGSASVVVDHGVLNFQSQVTARGEFGFLRLKSVTSRTRVNLGLELDATFHSDGPVERAQIVELGEYRQPFTIRIGPVRVAGVMHSTVRLGFEHNATGPVNVRTSFEGSGLIEMGGTYTMPETWSPHWEPSFEGTVTELTPEGSGDWEGRVFLIVDGHVTLDGVESGSSRFEVSVDSSVDSGCETVSWASSGSLEGQTEMKLRVLGRAVDHSFPHLAIEADAKEGQLPQVDPPDDCGVNDVTGECSPVAQISCGVPFSGNTATDPGATATMDGYTCNVGNYEAAELVYSWVATTSAPTVFQLIGATPTEVNHDLIVLDGSGNVCSSTNCIAQGFNSVEFEPVVGRTYFLVVDGFWEEVGAFVAELSCG